MLRTMPKVRTQRYRASPSHLAFSSEPIKSIGQPIPTDEFIILGNPIIVFDT